MAPHRPVADRHFTEPRLAAIYDPLDADRGDLDVYLDLVEQLGAHDVLDIGCGTGILACLLAEREKVVTGLDPAAASLDVARAKPGAKRVHWLVGDVSVLPPLQVDLVAMTGNVAQVFVDDEEWATVLRAARSALRPQGWLVFEVRDPEREGWKEWTRDQTHRRVEVLGVGAVETWVELTDVSLPLVTFRTTFTFASDGVTLTSDSALRFRTEAEVRASLATSGFVVREVHGAPDRPGHEMVFLAQVETSSGHR